MVEWLSKMKCRCRRLIRIMLTKESRLLYAEDCMTRTGKVNFAPSGSNVDTRSKLRLADDCRCHGNNAVVVSEAVASAWNAIGLR